MDSPRLEQHTLHKFDEEMNAIKSHVLGMGGLVERQLEDALSAIMDADSAKAEEILAREKQVNRMEVSVDEEAARILVKRQPAASDLRMILVISKTVRDLERMGDESKKIAKLAVMLAEEGAAPRGYFEVRHIGAIAERPHRVDLATHAEAGGFRHLPQIGEHQLVVIDDQRGGGFFGWRGNHGVP